MNWVQINIRMNEDLDIWKFTYLHCGGKDEIRRSLWGEIKCWSLLGVKRFINNHLVQEALARHEKKKSTFREFFPSSINTHLLKKINFSRYKLPIIFSARYINNLKDFLYFIYISKFSDTASKEQYLAFIIYILQPLINDQ